MDTYSDYDMEMAERGAQALAKVIKEELDTRVVALAREIVSEQDPDVKLILIGRMKSLDDFRTWMIEDGESSDEQTPSP